MREKLTRLRDETTPPKIFRELVAEIATLLLYEATADLPTDDREVKTPLASYKGARLRDKVGLIPVLRAGIGMVEAALELMPEAQVWHIGLFRDERTLRPIEYYNKLPSSATVQVCLVLDPMLATGGSATATIDVRKTAAHNAPTPSRKRIGRCFMAAPRSRRRSSIDSTPALRSTRGCRPVLDASPSWRARGLTRPDTSACRVP